VAAKVWYGDTDCSGTPAMSFPDALDAFAQFGGMDVNCAEMVCYEAGFVSFAPTADTTAPSFDPTMQPTGPTESPTDMPSVPPTTGMPSVNPTTAAPTEPTYDPTEIPTIDGPTGAPTPEPTKADGCNGVNLDVLGIGLKGPTDICFNMQQGSDYSFMYSCDTMRMHTYFQLDCQGTYAESELDENSTMTCDAHDCSYGLVTQYNESTNSSDGCSDDLYQSVPFSTDCYYLVTSLGGVYVELFCADNTTNGGDVSANIWLASLGATGCIGTPNLAYPNAMSAFSQFGIDGTCMDMSCYQPGYHAVNVTFMPSTEPTLAPTGEPTAAPVPTPEPTMSPTAPTSGPTQSPSMEPTGATDSPSEFPTFEPTMDPSAEPTKSPTVDIDNNSAANMITVGMTGMLIVAGLLRM